MSLVLMILLWGTIVAVALTARLSSAQRINNVRDVDAGVDCSLKDSAKQSNAEMKLNGTNTTISATQPDNFTSTPAQNDNHVSSPAQPDNDTSIPKEPNESNAPVLKWQIPEPKALLTP